MNTVVLHPSSAAPAGSLTQVLSDRGSTVRNWWLQLVAEHRRLRQRNRTIRELRRLPAWQLRELGVDWYQIPALVDAMVGKPQSH